MKRDVSMPQSRFSAPVPSEADVRSPDAVQLSATAHPVQGLVCVHGFRDEVLKAAPVNGIFAAIRELQVEVTLRLERIRGVGQQIELLTPHHLPAHDAGRLQDYVSVLCSRHVPEFHPASISIHPTWTPGWGIGSSAAVFAAIAKIILSFDGQSRSAEECREVKEGSYSAPASYLGGFSIINVGTPMHRPVAETIHARMPPDFRLLLLPVDPDEHMGRKSSEVLHREVPFSPYYEKWQREASQTASVVRRALIVGDIAALGAAVEKYAFINLAVMSTGPSNIIPWAGDTLAVLHFLRKLRERSALDFYMSINSGPSVFVLGSESTLMAVADSVAADKIISNVPILSAVGGKAELT